MHGWIVFANYKLVNINILLICATAILSLVTGWKIIEEIKMLRQRNQIMKWLVAIGNKFQSCSSNLELARLIMSFSKKLSNDCSGVVYMMQADSNYLEAVVIWGNEKKYEKKLQFNRYFIINGAEIELINHTNKKGSNINKADDILQPLMIGNKVLGLIHLNFQVAPKNSIVPMKKLITLMAKSASIALANLQLRDSLQIKSTHDPLTGLYNRYYLSEYLAKHLSLAARQRKKMSVIILDIDYFKEFNDDYGHDVADVLLMDLAALLQGETRTSDMICRFGGEEFIWVLYDCSYEFGRLRAEELRNKISKFTLHYKNNTYRPVTISLGIANYPDHGVNANDLILAADKALYQAKRNGRNRVVSYSEIKTT